MNFSIISIILGGFGILATALFGIWAIYIVIRKRYTGEITLVSENCIGLFDTIVKNFPELSILYQESPVTQGLVLFKGTVLNSGKKDITPEMVENKITLSLPEDFKWLAAKTVASSPNVRASVDVERNSLRFSTGLFRCNEYFKFEALTEVPVSDKGNSISAKLVSNIRPFHRIADTGKIRQVSLPPEPSTKKKLRKLIIMPIIFMLFGLSFLGFLFFRGMPVLRFEVLQQDGSVAEVSLKPSQDGTIHIKNKAYDIDEKVKVEQFFSRSDIRAKIVNHPHSKYFIALTILVYLIFPIVVMSFVLRQSRKGRRLRKQIGPN